MTARPLLFIALAVMFCTPLSSAAEEPAHRSDYEVAREAQFRESLAGIWAAAGSVGATGTAVAMPIQFRGAALGGLGDLSFMPMIAGLTTSATSLGTGLLGQSELVRLHRLLREGPGALDLQRLNASTASLLASGFGLAGVGFGFVVFSLFNPVSIVGALAAITPAAFLIELGSVQASVLRFARHQQRKQGDSGPVVRVGLGTFTMRW